MLQYLNLAIVKRSYTRHLKNIKKTLKKVERNELLKTLIKKRI